jgi:hypothetical protein
MLTGRHRGGVELEVHRHTQSGASAGGGFGALEVPSRLRRRRCSTCKPFSRHSRWIFLWLTRIGEIVSLPPLREISRARRLGANPYGLKFVPLPVRPFPPAVDGVPSFSRYASRMDRALMVSW